MMSNGAADSTLADLNWPESRRPSYMTRSDAFIGHPRQRHDLIGCSETRSAGARRVLHSLYTPFTLQLLRISETLGRKCDLVERWVTR